MGVVCERTHAKMRKSMCWEQPHRPSASAAGYGKRDLT